MVKPDGWIIRMAQEKGMIEPFEARQVKSIETPQGSKSVISYGVSSYGYDIRVARNFKVLDPVAITDGIVDPKRFDLSGYTSTWKATNASFRRMAWRSLSLSNISGSRVTCSWFVLESRHTRAAVFWCPFHRWSRSGKAR